MNNNLAINYNPNFNADFERSFVIIDIVSYLIDKIDDVMIEVSGFTLGELKLLRVQIFKNEPLSGSGYIKLPKNLQNKRAIVNFKKSKITQNFISLPL